MEAHKLSYQENVVYRRTDIFAQNFYVGETGMPMKGSAEMQRKVKDSATALRDIYKRLSA